MKEKISIPTNADIDKAYKELKTKIIGTENEIDYLTLKNLNEDIMVAKPPHYQAANGMEVINVIEAFTDGLTGMEAVDTANAIKYILRWKKKNGVQDLKKAKWYIEHLISKLETNE